MPKIRQITSHGPMNEVKLLPCSTMDYKTSKEMKNIDWGSCKNKYQDIHDEFVDTNDCHTTFMLTKAILNSK